MNNIDFNKIRVGALICVDGNVGTYFGREIESDGGYYNYPIIKLNGLFHECHSNLGVCQGLWIEHFWDVKIISNNEPCGIADFLMREG